MNYKIICNDRSIEFTNNYPALAFSEDSSRNFYRVNDNIIEVDYLEDNDLDEKVNFSRKNKMVFIILKNINVKNRQTIQKVLKYDNVIVSVMDKENFFETEKIIRLNGLNGKINVEALINMFSNEEILRRVKNKKVKSSIVIGDEDFESPIENILRSILNNFSHIENYKEYFMYIYSRREFDLQETAYLEDLLKEYLYNEDKIEIKQIKNSEIENNVFYSILAIR